MELYITVFWVAFVATLGYTAASGLVALLVLLLGVLVDKVAGRG